MAPTAPTTVTKSTVRSAASKSWADNLPPAGYDDQVRVMYLDGDMDAEADGNYYNTAPVEIDANVSTMVPVDMYFLVTLGTDGYLWLEQTPFNGTVPPQRAHVDGSVAY